MRRLPTGDPIALLVPQRRTLQGVPALAQHRRMTALLALLVFSLGFALDYADTKHKLAVEARNGHVAGCWSVAMYALGIFGTWAVLDVEQWLVVPTMLGLYFGSRVALRRCTAAVRTDASSSASEGVITRKC